MTNLTKILNEIADAFRKDKRHDGTEFYRLKDGVDDNGCADWLLREDGGGAAFMLRIHAAVDDRGPDDWVYETAYHMAQRLAESCEWTERHGDEWDPYEAINEAAEADVYTMDRLKWLAANLNNYVIVDEVAEESGTVGILDQIAEGQSEAMRRIGEAIYREARDELTKREGAEEDS